MKRALSQALALASVAMTSSLALQGALAAETTTPKPADGGQNGQVKTRAKVSDKAPLAERDEHAAKALSQSGKNIKLPSETAKKVQAKTTANAVNQIPGVQVAPNELESPELPPIKGFHPIKKLLRPVENIAGLSVKIEQQVIKMSGPIAALHPPMNNLEDHMGNVNNTMSTMESQVNGVTAQMNGVREDLNKMRKDIAELKQPILTIQKPLVGVGRPLDKLQSRLEIIFWAIIVGSTSIAIGTPVAAMYIYCHREKLLEKVGAAPKPDEAKEKELTASGKA